MNTWTLRPRDTLLLRDARPSSIGSGDLISIDFPWPSSLAGLLRTQIGSSRSGFFDLDVLTAQSIALRGPLLVELDEHGGVPTGDAFHHALLVPAPRDCVWFPSASAGLQRLRLQPIEPSQDHFGAQTDLDDVEVSPSRAVPRLLLGHPPPDSPSGKPVAGPAFWRWRDVETWLAAPVSEARVAPGFGHAALLRELRTHVSIDPQTQTARDERLFCTESLRFTQRASDSQVVDLALLFACDEHPADPETGHQLRKGLVTFGGERRLSMLRPAGVSLPSLSEKLKAALIARHRTAPRCLARVLLLTPALFETGCMPLFIGDERVRVVAAAVPRAQIVSGWDFAQRAPKPNRRMAAAGSVYWVELPRDLEVGEWLHTVHMKCLPNQHAPQDPRDGFGLCAVGVA